MTAHDTQPTPPASTVDRARALGGRLLRFVLRVSPSEQQRVFALTILIGGVCGLAAVLFHLLIRGLEAVLIDRAMAAPGHAFVFWTVVTPTLGALLSGLVLHYFLPSARGSGIPQVKYIYAVKSGRVRLRDALGKLVVASVQIGSGSSLGREGPTVQICAGIATSLGRMTAISPQNVRRLLPVGSAAGIAAAFNAPIAAVTFVIEELVRGLDQTVLSGVVVAAALAAVIERSILGSHPVLDVERDYGLNHASSLIVYAMLGVAAALLARVFCAGLLRLRAWFLARRGPMRWALPAVGGLVTGLLAVLMSLTLNTGGVTGGGYATLSTALAGSLSLELMIALALAKMVATAFCYSSGGAGGIFAPVLFIGAMLGGSFGYLDELVLGHTDTELGAFALVGMGAFFAAVIRAPMTSVLIIFEMTGGYGLVLPLMIANTTAYFIAWRLERMSIYDALLEQDGLHLPHTQDTATALTALQVSDAMTTELVVLPGAMGVSEALESVTGKAFSVYPVIGADGSLLGLVSEARLRRRVAEDRGAEPLAQHARAESYLRSDQMLVDAVVQMTSQGARQMAVVDPAKSERLVGMLAMSDVMRAHTRAAQPPNHDAVAEPTSQKPVAWTSRDTRW